MDALRSASSERIVTEGWLMKRDENAVLLAIGVALSVPVHVGMLFFTYGGWLVLSILVGVWASKRGHGWAGMYLVSTFFTPILGALIEAVRGRDVAVLEERQVQSGDAKRCPACAELVRSDAKKCRHCGDALE
jgi:hypothetical protein